MYSRYITLYVVSNTLFDRQLSLTLTLKLNKFMGITLSMLDPASFCSYARRSAHLELFSLLRCVSRDRRDILTATAALFAPEARLVNLVRLVI